MLLIFHMTVNNKFTILNDNSIQVVGLNYSTKKTEIELTGEFSYTSFI